MATRILVLIRRRSDRKRVAGSGNAISVFERVSSIPFLFNCQGRGQPLFWNQLLLRKCDSTKKGFTPDLIRDCPSLINSYDRGINVTDQNWSSSIKRKEGGSCLIHNRQGLFLYLLANITFLLSFFFLQSLIIGTLWSEAQKNRRTLQY